MKEKRILFQVGGFAVFVIGTKLCVSPVQRCFSAAALWERLRDAFGAVMRYLQVDADNWKGSALVKGQDFKHLLTERQAFSSCSQV